MLDRMNGVVAGAAADEPTSAPDHALNIYVHWPFCLSKCPYCDFNSVVARTVDHQRWQKALIRELRGLASKTAGRPVKTIYFGGGTPSLMPPAMVAAIIETVASCWPLAPHSEITIEVNPTSAEAGRFRDFRAAGVNRLSIGVQAMTDAQLQFLGRIHSLAESGTAIDMAHTCFQQVSLDLIYGLPGQSVADWRQQLSAALSLAGNHLSVYQLTVEPGTPFFDQGVPMADEETSEALWEETAGVLAGAGFSAYEVSNHARNGEVCQHNLAIWQGADYVGIGPGAHGRLIRPCVAVATTGLRQPETWLRAVESTGTGLETAILGREERATELVLMGLRLQGGIDAKRFQDLVSLQLEEVVNQDAICMLVSLGDLVADRHGIRTTAAGRLRLNAVLSALLC